MFRKEFGGILKEDVGNAWSKVKNITSNKKFNSTSVSKGSRGILSDWLGVAENNSNGYFYSVENQLGGNVYVSYGEIDSSNFENIIKKSNGKVNIISGIHGDINGNTLDDLELYFYDINHYESGNVNVFNYSSMDFNQLSNIINSSNTTICAWCFSERNPAVRMALKMGKK